MLPEVIFWISVAAIVYVYLGYPVLLAILPRLFRRQPVKRLIEPSVSLLVAAFNEEDVIEAKIRNSLDLDYPPSRLEIVVASDGSTDRTAEIVRRFAGERVKLFAYPVNRGKITVLNETVPHLAGEIVAFSDASSMLAPDALRMLVRAFADPSVGAVSGIYRVRKKEAAELGFQEDFYWKYETFLKAREAELDSTLGAHGSLYAIRKALYPYPKPGTINDDYVIPIRIVQQGYRAVYDLEAVAYEEAQEMSGFSRRVRIMTGNLQQTGEIKPLLRPFRLMPVFFFASHKLGRLVVPIALLTALVSNLALLAKPFYVAALVLQAGFYILAAAGAAKLVEARLLRLPYYFCMINAAGLIAMLRALLWQDRVAWKQ